MCVVVCVRVKRERLRLSQCHAVQWLAMTLRSQSFVGEGIQGMDRLSPQKIYFVLGRNLPVPQVALDGVSYWTQPPL